MMFIGHDSDRYGYLESNGYAMQAESIARRVGCSLPEFESLLSELTIAGVPSRTPDGSAIFSRRMVKDARLREVRSEAGKLGGRPTKYRKTNGVTKKSKPKAKTKQITEYENENLLVGNLKSKRKANYEEIRAYCVQLGFPDSDSEYLFNHWEGNGWINGKSPIRDWKATIRAWKAAGHLPSQRLFQQPTSNSPPGPTLDDLKARIKK